MIPPPHLGLEDSPEDSDGAAPDSLDSEAGIFMATFDHSGCRLLTAEADNVYKEDEEAVGSFLFVNFCLFICLFGDCYCNPKW